MSVAILDAPEPSLTEQACRQIRADIISCALRPGQAISESALALRYGLGKAPIRAALSRLSEAGLIRSVQRRGYLVAPITVKELIEVIDLRRLLEPHAAYHAAGRMENGAIEQFDRAYKSYRAGDLASEGEFLRANRAFHLAIAHAAGMPKLAEILGNLLDSTERALRLGLAERRGVRDMEAHHRAFVEALVGGDAEQASRLAAEGVDAVRRMVLEAIVKSEPVASLVLAPRR